MVAGTARGADSDRFAFGENWHAFSQELDEEKLQQARAALEQLLGGLDLTGRRFLDVGCGSGLMSLAAHRLGAEVVAFDYDADSVATTAVVRDRFAGADAYPVLQGSVLDPDFLSALGTFDVVYSWGVLHHTGDMHRAFDLVSRAVAPGGHLALAIYNDQGLPSRVWARVKKAYVQGSPVRRRGLLVAYGAYFRSRDLATTALRRPVAQRPRGMDRRHDLVDWIGGYPFEVARPEEVFNYFKDRGFVLSGLRTCRGGHGCNEFLFVSEAPPAQ